MSDGALSSALQVFAAGVMFSFVLVTWWTLTSIAIDLIRRQAGLGRERDY